MLRLAALATVLISNSTVRLGASPSGDEEPTPLKTESVRTEHPGVPAGFRWTNFDGDGLEDAYAIGTSGTGRLLRDTGDGSFEDVTSTSGLDALASANLALWHDFDSDGLRDLFIGTQAGGFLMRNTGDGVFQD